MTSALRSEFWAEDKALPGHRFVLPILQPTDEGLAALLLLAAWLLGPQLRGLITVNTLVSLFGLVAKVPAAPLYLWEEDAGSQAPEPSSSPVVSDCRRLGRLPSWSIVTAALIPITAAACKIDLAAVLTPKAGEACALVASSTVACRVK